MKKVKLLVAFSAAMMLAGCATSVPVGFLYTDMKLPQGATSNSGKTVKTGTAECMSVLSLVATGDCSIEAAKKNGGITKVNHVDWDAKNILGIIGNFKTIVYGE